MGKIFDALEKASRQTLQMRPAVPTKRSEHNVDLNGKGKVVPFADPKNPAQVHNMDRNLVVFHDPQSIESEMIKVLKTNLLFPSSGKAPKSIMITSAVPGDGKSFVSANLAISVAQGIEEHVLLIDSDIRNPSIDEYFGIGRREGLSEYLATGSDVSKKLVKTPVDKLVILPAGMPPSNPMELLATQKMKALLMEVTQRYGDRYIIIDSAPPSLAPETAAIAKYVDGIVIVVRAGKTPREAVSEVIDQLGKEKIIGLVLNHSDKAAKKYYGYGKAYYKTAAK